MKTDAMKINAGLRGTVLLLPPPMTYGKSRKTRVALFMLMFILLMCTGVNAAPSLVSPSPNSIGEIERITLDDPADVYSGGVLVAGGTQMILPRNLLIDLPANRLSLQQIFDQAPAACKALGESGLAKADKCNGSGAGAIATLSAVYTNAGNVIVGDLFIQKAAESVTGVVTYINYDQGYYRVNGIPNDPATGAMVRLNDPGLGANFGGNATLLPYALGSFPADPGSLPIAATPAPEIFPPIANPDSASTEAGVPVSIGVLANDFPVLGLIDPASVAIATPPASGTAQWSAMAPLPA